MPQYRSLKTLFIETTVFIGLFALVGHLSVNFWERYMIQSELSRIKSSLHSMKETITFIGKAYDNLYNEIKSLSKLAETKQSPTVLYNNIDRRKMNDLNIQAQVREMRDIKVGRSYFNKTGDTNKYDKMTCLDKNVTTITRLPLKSIGTDSQAYSYHTVDHECKYKNHGKIHKCYNTYGASPYQNWKF